LAELSRGNEQLKMRESLFEEVRRVFGDESRVARGRSDGRIERDLNVASFDETDEASEHESSRFETYCRRTYELSVLKGDRDRDKRTTLVISIGENEEHVGKERKVVSLEETVRSVGSSRNDVVDQFNADTIMRASPCKLEFETG